MSTRKRILLAVANGCRNTRQIAEYLGISYGAVNNYFYGSNNSIANLFVNGDLVQWDLGKNSTLRLGPTVAVIRHRGKIVDIGRVEEVD